MPLSILVTGATGFVGSQLVSRLLEDGHAVRGFVRDAGKVDRSDIEVAEGDAESGEGLPEAMVGIDVVYFLIHSMEGNEGFGEQERATAENVVDAAAHASVRRVVYLGGIVPEEDAEGGSEHLESRHEVEELLLAGFPESVAFRASMVIGAGSRSFDFLASITERMPVLALPAWHTNRTAPIDARDVVEYLARAATVELGGGEPDTLTLDVGGPEVMSYGDMVTEIARLGGHERRSFGVPVSLTSIAAPIAAAITGEDAGLIKPLMQSLAYDLIPDDAAARGRFGVDPHPFADSVRWALAEREEKAAAR